MEPLIYMALVALPDMRMCNTNASYRLAKELPTLIIVCTVPTVVAACRLAIKRLIYGRSYPRSRGRTSRF